MKSGKIRFVFFLVVFAAGFYILFQYGYKKQNFNPRFTVGSKIDSLNQVYVYYNGGVDHVEGRNTTSDGYNLGLKYQCVEFVKRYYYEHLHHKMPDSYGHARDFYDPSVRDGKLNKIRGLLQFTNPSRSKPRVNDLLVFDGTVYNKYGHVAIVSQVKPNSIEIIQQNAGPFGKTREEFDLVYKEGNWEIESSTLLGWLRKEQLR